jgi:2-keto-3-deoxy-L-rhamnonate aldolase RhmA
VVATIVVARGSESMHGIRHIWTVDAIVVGASDVSQQRRAVVWQRRSSWRSDAPR